MEIGGGVALQLHLYDPEKTVFNTWDKSYSFDIGPGKSYKVGLSVREYEDVSNIRKCIPEGKRKSVEREFSFSFYILSQLYDCRNVFFA